MSHSPRSSRNAAALVLLAAIAGSSFAQSLTRDDVKAEFTRAQRSGELMPAGEANLMLRDMTPSRYPAQATGPTRSRDQVRAETLAAARQGDLLAAGEADQTQRQIRPDLYPRVASGPAKTRGEVVAEFREARRSGDLMATGDADMTLREMNPKRYGATASRLATAPTADQRASSAATTGATLR